MPAERLTPGQVERYQAHLALLEFGAEGQRRLLESRVLLVGVGGLGCPAAQYLVAAGVGLVGLLDDDIVDATNLQRQVLYAEADVGRPKAEVAAERLSAVNSGVTVVPLGTRLTAANAHEIVSGYDVVVDGSDNFATRYVVNDACVLAGAALVSGSLYRYDGQVTTIRSPETGCYRCLFASPPPEQAPCQGAGVLGALAGMIGTIQAAEATRLLVTGQSGLLGALLLVDARDMSFRRVSLRRDPACPLCGDSPSILEPTAVAVCRR